LNQIIIDAVFATRIAWLLFTGCNQPFIMAFQLARSSARQCVIFLVTAQNQLF